MSVDCRLERMIEAICGKHGIPLLQGKAAFSALIVALHETRTKAFYPELGLLQQTYFALGEEAAYHLGGILEVNEPGMVTETLQRMDPELSRFKTTLDRWQMEINCERLQRE